MKETDMKNTMIHARYAFILLCLFMLACPVWAAQEVEIHGFASQGYMQSSDNNFLANTDEGTFEFNEMGLNFSYDSGANVKIGAQLFARDLGGVGNDEVAVNWAFGDYKWRDWLGFRAGIMKSFMGLYNETRDVDSLRTCLILPQSVYNEWIRDATQGTKGFGVYGNVSAGPAGVFKYEIRALDLQVPLDSGTGQFIQRSLPSLTGIDFDKLYALSLRWQTPLDGLLFGVSGYTTKSKYEAAIQADMDADLETLILDNKETTSIITSVEYTLNNLVLASECTSGRSDSRSYVQGVTTPGAYNLVKQTNYYFSAAYRFLDWFEAGTYYSYGTRDNDGSGAANELKDICVSTRFDVTDNMIVKLETHFMDGLYGVAPGDDGSTDDKWMLYAAKVSYTF